MGGVVPRESGLQMLGLNGGGELEFARDARVEKLQHAVVKFVRHFTSLIGGRLAAPLHIERSLRATLRRWKKAQPPHTARYGRGVEHANRFVREVDRHRLNLKPYSVLQSN